MRKIYSSNVAIAESGAIGKPAEVAGTSALLLPRPAPAEQKARATYGYATNAARMGNHSTKAS